MVTQPKIDFMSYADRKKVNMKPYQNIVTDKPESYIRYLVIGDYDTLEEAEANYESDIKIWTEQNEHTTAYQLCYPFGYATICDKELLNK